MIFTNNLRNNHHAQSLNQYRRLYIDVLAPVRRWLNQLEVHNAAIAHSICQWIPAQCPFARTISWRGHKLFVIPPLCKLNPLYDELMGLRFRALSYLADQCCADVYIGGQVNAEPAKSC